jgi:hypothetical protein
LKWKKRHNEKNRRREDILPTLRLFLFYFIIIAIISFAGCAGEAAVKAGDGTPCGPDGEGVPNFV